MADNLTTQSTTPATVPASTQIATDEVASVHYQRVKLVDGTADSTTAIPGDATNGLDVDVTRVQGTVNVADGGGSLTVDGTVAVSSVGGTVAVSGPLTDTQLRASSVPVSDGGGSLTVDGTVGISGTVPVSGTFYPATQPVSGTVGVSGTVTVDGSNVTQPVSGTVAVSNFPTTQAVSGTFWQATQPVSGSVTVSNLPATQAVSWTSQSVSITGTPTVSLSGTNTVTQTPATSGGLSAASALSAASTNATVVKSSAGQVFGWVITNTSASPRYIKFYNKSTTPTVGTDTPFLRLMVPGNTSGAGLVAAEFVNGITFAAGNAIGGAPGIGYAITVNAGDSDTTVIGANEVIVNVFYK